MPRQRRNTADAARGRANNRPQVPACKLVLNQWLLSLFNVKRCEALRRSQIQVLLRELRKEQAVHSVGLTKGARWFPGPAPTNCNREEPSV